MLCFWPTLDVRWNLFLTFPPPPCSFPQSNLTQNMIYNDLSTFYTSHTHHQLLHPSEDPDWIPASALPQPQDVFYWVSCLQMVVYSCLGIWAKENWIAPHKVTPAASWLQMQTAVSGEQKMAAAHWYTNPIGFCLRCKHPLSVWRFVFLWRGSELSVTYLNSVQNLLELSALV